MHDSQSAQISLKQGWVNIYVIIKTMWPCSHPHNRFEATHALGHIKLYIMCPTQVQLICNCFIFCLIFAPPRASKLENLKLKYLCTK